MSAEQIGMIPPDTNGGWPTHFNWFGANECQMVGRGTKGNSDYNLKNQPCFKDIPDEKWKTARPTYNIGIQDNDHGKGSDMYYVTAAAVGETVRTHKSGIKDYSKSGTVHGKPKYNDKSEIQYLFEEGGMHSRGFIHDFKGYYNTNDWYQNNAFVVYNTNENKIYPFPVKGIAFTIRIPKGKQGLDAWGQDGNFGDHLQINQMHGLWMDKNKKYYSYELLPQGDNKGKARVSKLRQPWWNDDPSDSDYYFLRTPDERGTNFWIRDNHPDLDEAMKIRAFTLEPKVEDLYFMGFACCVRCDKQGAAQNSHTMQFSNVAPIPYFSPRPPHPFAHRVIVGAPTELSEIKKGGAKIHYDGGRNTKPGFTGSKDTKYRPDDICPGYGENEDFGDVPPDLLPREEAPDDFEIEPKVDQELNKDIISAQVTLQGIQYTVTVTATNGGLVAPKNNDKSTFGEYAPSIVLDRYPDGNQRPFKVKMKSSDQYETTVTTEVTAGTGSPVTWMITTKEEPDDGD